MGFGIDRLADKVIVGGVADVVFYRIVESREFYLAGLAFFVFYRRSGLGKGSGKKDKAKDRKRKS